MSNNSIRTVSEESNEEDEMDTAVNTPLQVTPSGSRLDLSGLGKEGRKSARDLESGLDLDVEASDTLGKDLESGRNEKIRSDGRVKGRDGGMDGGNGEKLGLELGMNGRDGGMNGRNGKIRRNSSVRRTITRDEVEMEGARLRRELTTGSHRHGGREKTAMIDLGNGMEQVFVVDWLDHDPENPFNWSSAKKYANVIVAVLITTLTAANATSTAILAEWGPERFNCSREQYILSSTVFLITVAFTPLVLAPLSEVFGRMWIYQITGLINALLFIPQALSPSYSGLLAARWFQGMCASVGNSMVGGTVADLFFPKDRGLAMNVFSIMIFLGQSLGGFVFGWVGNGWGIQWCYGVQGIAAVVSCGLNALILRETRGDVLLARRAKALTKETGSKHICVADLQKQSFITLMRVSLIRPLEYLVTEPIVSAISTWIGFAWAIIFLGGTSVQLVFRAYGFSIGQAGTVQVCVFLGGVLGFISNFHQDRLYARAARKNGGRAPPEARLYWAAYGGLLFPLGMYVYAWTSRPGSIPWPVPAVFLTISYWGVFCMYSGTFTYLADAYETYSSSAQAAQSFARNFASGIFPLFGHQMYIAMGYPQATTLVASVALFLSIAPILLVRYGHVLRARSRVASALQREAEEAEK